MAELREARDFVAITFPCHKYGKQRSLEPSSCDDGGRAYYTFPLKGGKFEVEAPQGDLLRGVARTSPTEHWESIGGKEKSTRWKKPGS